MCHCCCEVPHPTVLGQLFFGVFLLCCLILVWRFIRQKCPFYFAFVPFVSTCLLLGRPRVAEVDSSGPGRTGSRTPWCCAQQSFLTWGKLRRRWRAAGSPWNTWLWMTDARQWHWWLWNDTLGSTSNQEWHQQGGRTGHDSAIRAQPGSLAGSSCRKVCKKGTEALPALWGSSGVHRETGRTSVSSTPTLTEAAREAELWENTQLLLCQWERQRSSSVYWQHSRRRGVVWAVLGKVRWTGIEDTAWRDRGNRIPTQHSRCAYGCRPAPFLREHCWCPWALLSIWRERLSLVGPWDLCSPLISQVGTREVTTISPTAVRRDFRALGWVAKGSEHQHCSLLPFQLQGIMGEYAGINKVWLLEPCCAATGSFNLIRRQGRKGGGVAMYVWECSGCLELNESLWVING